MRMITGIAVLSTLMASSALAQTGNGAPKGAHYTLNIIGVENPKKTDLTDSNRHTIFVALGAKGAGVETKIYLGASPDFVVCDGNGFDAAHDCTGTLVSPADGASSGCRATQT